MKTFLSILIMWMGLVGVTWAAESERVDTGRVHAQLVSSHDLLMPGQSLHVALVTDLDPGWHTYWFNPGDSGEPVAIDLTLPEGASAGEIFWPIPYPVATGPIINYGFEGSPVFPIEVTVPEGVGSQFEIEASVYYLVCKDICVPESTTLSLNLPVSDEVIGDPVWGPRIVDAISASPVRAELEGSAQVEAEGLLIEIAGRGDIQNPYLFPMDNKIVDHSAPQTFRAAENGLALRQTAGFGWQDAVPEAFDAVLAYDTPAGRRGEIVRVETDGRTLDIGAFVAAPSKDGTNASANLTFPLAILFAFLGGIILNVMPCVFPVISIKALSLTKAAHAERVQARREGWAYTAGVIAMFMALAVVVLAIKASGSLAGWGFQLQDPRIVGILALLVFLVGLNFLGVFEIGGQLQNAGHELTTSDGVRGAFFTGLLAVIVATPCTGPFMAGALGYTLLAPAPVTVAVFLALAIGFAAPFLLLAYTPALLSRLPKPGPWMETFRQFLAFPMFATAIWLVYVLAAQAGQDGVTLVLIAALLFTLAIWFRRKLGKVGLGVGLALALIGMMLPMSVRFAETANAVSGETLAELGKMEWSPEALAAERRAGRAVFVDFTADWCVSCKVNERGVLSREDVNQAFVDTDTVFMVADWTNKNDQIAQELASYGRAGVPLYLLYPAGDMSAAPEILPQILTPKLMRDALKTANSR